MYIPGPEPRGPPYKEYPIATLYKEGTVVNKRGGIHSGSSFGSLVHLHLTLFYIPTSISSISIIDLVGIHLPTLKTLLCITSAPWLVILANPTHPQHSTIFHQHPENDKTLRTRHTRTHTGPPAVLRETRKRQGKRTGTSTPSPRRQRPWRSGDWAQHLPTHHTRVLRLSTLPTSQCWNDWVYWDL